MIKRLFEALLLNIDIGVEYFLSIFNTNINVQ
jgi:hypothetical protein